MSAASLNKRFLQTALVSEEGTVKGTGQHASELSGLLIHQGEKAESAIFQPTLQTKSSRNGPLSHATTGMNPLNTMLSERGR